MKTKQEATKMANALVRVLNWKPFVSKGWKPVVWENLGWHAKAVSACGYWKVHANEYCGKADGFTAFLGTGSVGGRWAESRRTAKAAIDAVRSRAKDDLREIQTLLGVKS